MATQVVEIPTNAASTRGKSALRGSKVCPIRVLELRSIRGTGGGPDKTILYGAAAASDGVAVTVCYLRDARDDQFAIDARARRLGLDYIEVVERHSFDPAIWPPLRRIIRDRRIQIVHAHDYKTNLLALLLARAEPIIPMTTAHGWSGNSTRERFYYAADRRLMGRFPVVVAVSQRIRERVIAHGADPARVRHIRNGVDTNRFRCDAAARARARAMLGVDDRTVLIGAVGRLAPEKRFDLLLEALAAVRRAGPFALAIAGEGPCREALTAHADALGLRGALHLMGQVEDPRDVHQALDIYVQSSDTEGVPNAVLEAMAIGTPIVATDVGGTRELIDDGVHGRLVPAGNMRVLADAILSTWTDGDGASRHRAAARERVERELSFAARVHAIERIYGELLTAVR